WNLDSVDPNGFSIEGTAEAGDAFGSALAAGDFDDDGIADLAVGVPGEGVNGFADAGAVSILYGSDLGLDAAGDQIWHQDSVGPNSFPIDGVAEAQDAFGTALAVGDFDNDGYADLAVGVPGEDIGATPISNAGAVNVLYGSGTGLTDADNQRWHQNSPGIDGVADADDAFGSALAAGDFDDDGDDDLAVGVPGEDIGVTPIGDAGAVNVIYGSDLGLTDVGNQRWHQDSPGIKDSAEESDFFGSTLAAGDFDNNGKADLAVGVPGEDIDTIGDAGAVNVLYGADAGTGLDAADDQFWNQDSVDDLIDILDLAESGDGFGG
ncbi:MAG: hypothetical protein L0Z62_09200, partial [Gemmataceae bacterium]|nr:hypothetical protein [Gemmataceae bacterium]